jgi:hypothetical protein
MVRTNSTGDTLWTRTYGGEWQEEIYDIEETSDGGFAAVGYTYSFGAGSDPNIYFIKTDGNGLITNVQYEGIGMTPNNFSLEQNYPNPFNPSTKIKYTIPLVGTQRAVSVQLKVYDVLGNEVATLVKEEKPAGRYEVEFNPSSINHHPSSGVYFCRLQTENYSKTIKMLYLK